MLGSIPDMATPDPGPPSRLLRALLVGSVALVMACGQATTSPSSGPSGAPTAGQPSATSAETASPEPTEAPAGLRLEAVTTGLSSPVDVVPSDDGTGRIFVVEQGGRIRVVRDGAVVEQPFLDISERLTSGGERGLLGLALHPNFPDDPRFFVDYTDLDGNTVISSFTLSLDADSADPESERALMHIAQPFPNHNGGAVVFGPDGMLYIAMGDGGSGGDPQGNGQRLDTHLAKILRIDVDVPTGQNPSYRVPPDNPFTETAGALPEIWHTGVRNPWRMRFNPANGDLWIGDVGQNAWEEIDVARSGQKGLNFGWNTIEGFECFNPSDGCDPAGLTLPVAAYGHDLGCAVVGGVVVHDPAQSAIDGLYVFADDCSGNVWTMDPVGDERREPTLALKSGRAISAIGQAEDGAVYMVDLGSGELLRLVAG
jgi:glucose/arabinose dehydrogenase